MAQKKYVSLERLHTFLDKLPSKFAALSHKHKVSDLTDFSVDSALSNTSTNPVQNKVIDAEFDAVSAAMQALESAVDGDVASLQSQIDTKAPVSHGTHVNYSTVAPVMDGAASAGSASTVSRSDHRHPVDTSRAAKTDFDTHVADTTKHITSAERTAWNSAKSHASATHAPTDAEKNQNAFSHVKVGDVSVSADTATDTLNLVAGTNVTITPDDTNDKITISATNTTYSAGTGISLSGTKINNSGVRSISSGSANGTISVNTNGTTADVAVKGLGSAAYTASSAYDASGSAANALTSAKAYADSAAAAVKNDLLNGAGTAYDTLKELGDLIDQNQDAIDALETVASGKADVDHGHEIADVSGLQTALNGKAASSHGVHVNFSSASPLSDGTASAGSESTVARSDHKHPTDTSRAAKSDFDSHTSNTTAHITSTERTNWGAAYTHSQTAHAPSNAEKNQNAFSNIKVGTTTVAADTTTDTVEFVGSNVTITPDATNDKITFTVASGSTSAKGIVKLTNSTSSTSTTTAATPSSVKAAYDAAVAAQSTADGKANVTHGHTVSDITDLTATATELNYMDGVTSSVQTQLSGKAPTSHASSATTYGIGTGSNYGHVKLSDSTNSTSAASAGVAATPAAVKAAYDLANGKANASHTHAASDITSGTLASARLPAATTSALGGVKIGSNISVSSGVISVPTADGSTEGVTKVYPAASCTTFSSDNGTVTPLAVQKGAKMFAITRPQKKASSDPHPGTAETTTDNAIVRWDGTNGDVQDSTIIIEDVTNTRDKSKAQVIAVPASGGKKMVYGYCTDQVDGTSFIGGIFDASATEYPYNAGLAIGGSSGNLLWKGSKVATTSDLPTLSSLGGVPTSRKINGKALTSDISLTAADVGALSSSTTIPKVNNGTLTIQKNGTKVATFSANSAGNATANITVPTGAAADKGVDTSISAASTSTNLPTSKAVAAFVEGKGYKTTDNDTKNTAGSTNTSSKIFLVGATSQAANPQTYSHDTAYVGTDGCLYSNSTKVSVEGHNHAGQNINPSAIELSPGASAGHGGYIDFHYNNSTADCTSRIWEKTSGVLQAQGSAFQVPDAVPGTAYARNIICQTTDLVAGTTSMTTGRIVLVYE